MKALLAGIALVTLIASSFACSAQCPSNKGQLEITGSYGIVAGDQFSDQVAGNTTKKLTYNSGNTFATLRYHFFSCLAFGITGGITNVKGQYNDAYNPATVKSTYQQSLATVAFEVYYVYTFRKYLELYTLLGAGPSFTNTTTTINATSTTPAVTESDGRDAIKIQYTPIGVRVGGRLGGFVELGIGFKGLLNAGISFKFGRPCWWQL